MQIIGLPLRILKDPVLPRRTSMFAGNLTRSFCVALTHCLNEFTFWERELTSLPSRCPAPWVFTESSGRPSSLGAACSVLEEECGRTVR